ncbi:MAG: hypothetical protein CL942_07365 [Desulfovibrio sp.]|nr:hypothetical protein [Desulfovibrio sp.]|tara:strand:- start:1696 stop:2004 length:309 start_codon:yes stop_codon:yes gene_type:complete
MDFATIASLRKYLTVKHSLPGTIKIKFSLGIMNDPEALKLAQSPPAMPDAVTKADLNIFSRTLELEYDPERIDPVLLEELINTEDNARASTIVETLHQAVYA